MILGFHRWPSRFKIALFTGIFLLAISIVVFTWIKPSWKKLQFLRQQHTILNAQWQQHHLAMTRRQQLFHDLVLLRYPYLSRLQALHHIASSAVIYTQITRLIKTQNLQILAIKPQKQLQKADLIQQIFSVDLNGSESGIFNFIKLLMHQPWLTDIQQIELTTLDQGIHLQATFSAYYA